MALLSLPAAERAVLAAAQLNADETIEALATRARLSIHTARRALERLKAKELIRPYPVINHFALGKFEIGLYVNLTHASRATGKSLALDNRKITHAAVTRVGGRFNLCIDLLCTQPAELVMITHELFRRSTGVLLEQEIVIRTGRTIFQRKLFGVTGPECQKISFAPASSTVAVSVEDERLLDLMSKLPDESLAFYGRKLGYSAAGVAYRINSLKNSGIYLGRAYAVLALKLGLLVFRVLVTMRSMTQGKRESFLKFCGLDRAVVTVTECIGAWNFELRVEGESADDLSSFRERLDRELGDLVQRIETVPFLGTEHMSGFSP